jgi:glutamate-1-semialdehyde 2,1-aminomutase
MKYLAAGIQTGDKGAQGFDRRTMAATPLSCVAGYHMLEEIEKRMPARQPG